MDRLEHYISVFKDNWIYHYYDEELHPVYRIQNKGFIAKTGYPCLESMLEAECSVGRKCITDFEEVFNFLMMKELTD